MIEKKKRWQTGGKKEKDKKKSMQDRKKDLWKGTEE